MPPPVSSRFSAFTVVVEGDAVAIPDRIYNPPISDQIADELDLTDDERTILSCLYSRHHNGYVRQANIERVIVVDRPWVPPFVIKLIGEYVIETVELIRDALATEVPGSSVLLSYRHFLGENPAFLTLTSQRATSYWDCYYRGRYPNREDYPAFAVLAIIGGSVSESDRLHPQNVRLSATLPMIVLPMSSPSRDELWSQLPAEVQAKAARLDRQHVAEDAFPVALADSVLTALGTNEALVLGGDFWIREDDRFHPVYANWNYDEGVAPQSIEVARRTLQEPWVNPAWYVTFVWR